MIKATVSKEIEKLKEDSKAALQRKDRQYAELKREKDNLKLKKYVVEATNENLGKEINELKQKLKQQQEQRVEENKVVENLVETLKVRVDNHDAEVQKLLSEVISLERNENFLKNSMESMEGDIEHANRKLVEKDECITNMKTDMLNLKESSNEEVVYYKQAIEVLENKIESIEMENEMFNKSLLNKDIELGNIAKENHESKERINGIQADLTEKLQEIQDLESIHTAKDRKVNSLEQKQKKEEKD